MDKNRIRAMRKEKLEFIEKHAKEIIPIADDRKTLDEILSGDIENVGNLDIEKTLEGFETRFYVLNKKGSVFGARKVLISASDPGAYNAIRPILSLLQGDNRCGSIGVLVDGVAGKSFARDFGADFNLVRGERTLAEDLLANAGERPFDVILATGSSMNGAESVLLYGGETELGATKTFFISEGWGASLGSAFGPHKKNMSKIDGIFCEDELAKRLIMRELPEIDESRIFMTGTPVTDSSLETKKADAYREKFRKEFGIADNDLVIAYLATISSALEKFGGEPQIEQKALDLSLAAIQRFADKQKDNRKVVVALKTHPRDPHPESFARIADKYRGDPNIEIKFVPKSSIMNEVAYGADAIMGTLSTELFLAPLRNRAAILLAYSQAGLGGDVLRNVYGADIVKVISQRPMTSVISNVSELSDRIDEIIAHKEIVSQTAGDSAKRILNIVL